MLTGTAGNDQLSIRLLDANTLQVSDGTNSATVSTSNVTSITVDGGGGNDTLTLSGNLGASAAETFNVLGAASGNIVTTGGNLNTTLSFSNVEGVTDLLNAASLTINATDQRDVLRLVNGDTSGGATTFRLESVNTSDKVALLHHTGSSTNPVVPIVVGAAAVQAHLNHGDELAPDQPGDSSTLVPLTFANKGAVTINLKGGDDFLLIDANTASGLTSLTVNGGDGSDVVAVRNLGIQMTSGASQAERIITNADEIFVEQLYQLRLGRVSDAAGLANWLALLRGAGGRQAVVSAILSSPEALGRLVDDLYEQVLGRHADEGGRAAFTNFLLNGGTLEQASVALAFSAEFQIRAGRLGDGTQQEQLVRTLYLALLQRDASSGEVAASVNLINTAGVGALVTGIVQSREGRELEVRDLYLSLFHREADLPGLNAWLNAELDLLAIRFAFLQSNEAFDRS